MQAAWTRIFFQPGTVLIIVGMRSADEGQFCHHSFQAGWRARERAQYVQCDDIARPFPDRVQRRLAEQARHGSFLNIAGTSETFECLIDKAWLAFADPVFGNRCGQPDESSLRIVRPGLIETSAQSQRQRRCRFALDYQVGQYGSHCGLINQRLLKHPAV